MSLSPPRQPVKNARSTARQGSPVRLGNRAQPGNSGPGSSADGLSQVAAIGPIKRTRIPEEIANRLRTLILDGTFKLEQALPSERELALRLGVSRGSVRDGIRRLEVLGLVESRHGQGTYPHELSVDNLVMPLASALTVNHARQNDLMDVRRIFEPAVARVAALRITGDEIEQIDRLLADQRRKVRAGQSTIGEDTAFHAALARATHNPVVVRLMETLNDLMVNARTRTLQHRGRPMRSLRGHEAIVDAMRRRDADGAAVAMSEHIDQIAALLSRSE